MSDDMDKLPPTSIIDMDKSVFFDSYLRRQAHTKQVLKFKYKYYSIVKNVMPEAMASAL
jgi:hypothetical protein